MSINVLLAFFILSMPNKKNKMSTKTSFSRFEFPKNTFIPAQQPMEIRF
jgi:hypothetical protein